MGLFSKLLATGVGFVLGGPIGALIGFAVGSLFGNGAETAGASTRRTTSRPTEGDFQVSLLVLIACVMKADGRVVKAELDVVKRFLVRNFGEQGALEALQLLKKLLAQPINETEVARQINRYMNYSTKLELVHLLLDIAHADGNIVSEERAVIQRVASVFSISAADFESLSALYVKHIDKNWAYKALEIAPTATDDDVKKAYRRMAMKYHPDKVTSAGEAAKRSATEKFRAINEAYEAIKAQRGIK